MTTISVLKKKTLTVIFKIKKFVYLMKTPRINIIIEFRSNVDQKVLKIVLIRLGSAVLSLAFRSSSIQFCSKRWVNEDEESFIFTLNKSVTASVPEVHFLMYLMRNLKITQILVKTYFILI